MTSAPIHMPPQHEPAGPARYTRVGRLVVQRRFVSLLRDNGFDEFDSFFEPHAGESLGKPGLGAWRQRVRLTLRTPDGTECTAYLKRYENPPLGRQILRWLSGRAFDSTAGVEWRAISRLAAAAMPVPEPIAYGRHMRGWFEVRSFVLMAEVPGVSLEAWLPANWRRDATGPARARQQQMIRRLARQIAAFHSAGFVHRDLYVSHIFLRDPASETPRFTFIDLQRVFRPRWRRTRWIVKDLAALNYSVEGLVSRTDRLRFWRAYADAAGRPRRPRLLLARIDSKTDRVRRHDARRRAAAGGASR